MIPAVARPLGWYDAPVCGLHCGCAPCAAPRCNGKPETMECVHGEYDITCEHRFCTIDSCRELLKENDDDLCEQHQLIYDTMHGEVRR